jgi:hypothetical protein
MWPEALRWKGEAFVSMTPLSLSLSSLFCLSASCAHTCKANFQKLNTFPLHWQKKSQQQKGTASVESREADPEKLGHRIPT